MLLRLPRGEKGGVHRGGGAREQRPAGTIPRGGAKLSFGNHRAGILPRDGVPHQLGVCGRPGPLQRRVRGDAEILQHVQRVPPAPRRGFDRALRPPQRDDPGNWMRAGRVPDPPLRPGQQRGNRGRFRVPPGVERSPGRRAHHCHPGRPPRPTPTPRPTSCAAR